MRISSSPIAVSKRSTKKSSRRHRAGAARAGDHELARRGPAPRAPGHRPGRRGRSAPPKVPRCRIWASATSAAALVSSRACSLDQGVVHDVVVRGQRADDDGVAVVADAAQAVDPAQVDDHVGGVQPHPQHGQQALAAGHDLGVVAVLGRAPERLLDGGRRQVVELGGDHAPAPSVEEVPGSDSSKCGIAAACVVPPPAWRRVDRLPDPLGRARHRDVVDAEVADRVDDRVDHGRRRGDGARLAHALGAERVGGRRPGRVVDVEARSCRPRSAAGSRRTSRSPACRRRRTPPPPRAPGRCPARARRAPDPRRSAG